MKFLKYKIVNTEPLKIVDIGESKDGETSSVSYIPGSTFKGAVINKLVIKYKNDTARFETLKKQLLSENTMFMNSYMCVDDNDFFPSPKGFYESKAGDKKLQNVVSEGKFDEGYKRANLGVYSVFDDKCVKYISPEKSEAMNINVKSHDVYRTDYIKSGYTFSGYIGFSENVSDDTISEIEELLRCSDIRLGSSRSSGYGCAYIKEYEIMSENDYPFKNISVLGSPLKERVVYMMLLSPMSMRNKYGEICGFDKEGFEKIAGTKLKNEIRASTTVMKTSGFNRTWRARTPEYTMYAPGSVFRLEFEEIPDAEKLLKIEKQGLGIGKNDGFGRVVFLDGYDKIVCKDEYLGKNQSDTDISDIPSEDICRNKKIIAQGLADFMVSRAIDNYVQQEENILNTSASNSQVGVFRSICQKYRYQPENAYSEFKSLIEQIEKKELRAKTHTLTHGSQKGLIEKINHILQTDLFGLLGIEENVCGYKLSDLIGKEKQGILKITILEKLMHTKNRKEKKK
ncbi:MAG: hypothetical protein J6A58_04945 [Oscillospiraceae bacterium]|nr:hypothetical protein [Oscillospiraceae bacterium]